MSTTLKSLFLQLNKAMLCDQRNFFNQIKKVEKINDVSLQQISIEKIASNIDLSIKLRTLRQQSVPRITYPDNLPVILKKTAILEAIRDNQVIIIAGETGSGKTTQLPKICLELGRGINGFIGHTQPRRLAARTVADRLAHELNSEIGGTVGYKVRFNERVSDTTLIKLMTDGILLAEIQQDRLLMKYDTIIIDEAHERSLNIDFILGYLRKILDKRPDLKVIITSATIDSDRFSNHFNHAPIIEVSGRTYPVEVLYRPITNTEEAADQLQAIISAIDELSQFDLGDILIFMSGEREIRDTANSLNRLGLLHTEIVPLYARLSASDQNRVFQLHQGRRIILATNVAETSLTVPGIKYVIDPGNARVSRYSFRTKVQRLPIEPISQASANQRKGRCGRTSNGICIRLYSEQDFLSRSEFTDPEILRTNLASVILQMMSLGLGDIVAFPFIEVPDNRNIQDGLRLLKELGAIYHYQQKHYKLTSSGKILAQLPIDPRLARMMLEAKKNGCVREMMIITSALSIQDPRERPLEKQQASDEKHRRFNHPESDFLTYVQLWDYVKEQQKTCSTNQFRQQCKNDYLNYLRLREWQDIYTQLRQIVKELNFSINQLPADYRGLHCSLLAGLLSKIGTKDIEKQEFAGAHGAKFALFPASVLFKKPPKWVIVAELLETSKLWGRIAARIDPQWIEPLALHLIKRSYYEPHWSKKQGAVIASEKVTLYGLPIVVARTINYSQIDPELCRELFIRHALVDGNWLTKHCFFHENLTLLAKVEDLETKSRRRDILVDSEILFHFYHQRIALDVVSSQHFDQWWKKIKLEQPDLLNFKKSMLIKENARTVTALDYPNFWNKGDFKLPLSYQFDPGTNTDGVTVHIPLQILNQIDEDGFDWQISGLRYELIIALIKSLPKPIRRNFIPAPNYTKAFLERVTPLEQPLLDSLEKELRQMTGVTVSRDMWQFDQIPTHLKITFQIVGENNQVIIEGDNLVTLKHSLREDLQKNLTTVADEGIEQHNLQHWNFGQIAKSYCKKKDGYELKAYPTLMDKKNSVSIQLVDTELEQQSAMWLGIRRLLLLNIPSPIKYVREKLPNKAKLGLYFNPFGQVLELIDDCIACSIDKLIARHGGLVWNESDFLKLKQFVRTELNSDVITVANKVEKIVTAAYEVNKYLKGKVDISMALALSDIKMQLSGLIFPGFVAQHGWQRLINIERYLSAIKRRLEKLPTDTARDRLQMLKIEQVQKSYQQLLNKRSDHKMLTNSVKDISWMIEELRVSYFAQQLGTAYPISDKRIFQFIEQQSLT